MMKRVLKWAGVVVALLALAAGGVWFTAFGSNSPIVDGQKLAPGVETVKDGFVSAFLIDAGPGSVVLVDAGHDAAARAIVAALQRRGLTPASVAAIFLTHGHGDHTAGCKMFPSAQVYAMDSEIALVGDAASSVHPLHDGDVTTVGELKVETFATPGHTAGSAVFLARGVLFFGDSAGASKDGHVMKAVGLFSKDSGQNVASLKALAARLTPRAAEITELAFAHTGPLAGLAPLATFASSH
jgi:glyoxylase-like metal-dependent hydrolase (beta-lactamase superfamily II)